LPYQTSTFINDGTTYTPYNYQNPFIYLFLYLVKSYRSLIALILSVMEIIPSSKMKCPKYTGFLLTIIGVSRVYRLA